MKTLYFESRTAVKFETPVSNHQFMLRYIPGNFAGQDIISAKLEISPTTAYSVSCDSFGNLQQIGCVDFPHDEFIYSVKGVAVVSHNGMEKGVLNPIFKFPSRFTKTNEKMEQFLKSLELSGSDFEKCRKLSVAIYDKMRYKPFETTTATTAISAFEQGTGVCQDFAHIYIALARLSGIPARYASGLQVGEGQSHAWAEVYIDGGWLGFDPTQSRLVGDDYIRFCVGRDFGDCALERGTFIGKTFQTQTTIASVVER